jgi:hypothetical protein
MVKRGIGGAGGRHRPILSYICSTNKCSGFPTSEARTVPKRRMYLTPWHLDRVFFLLCTSHLTVSKMSRWLSPADALKGCEAEFCQASLRHRCARMGQGNQQVIEKPTNVVSLARPGRAIRSQLSLRATQPPLKTKVSGI